MKPTRNELIEGLPFAEYRRIRAINFSTLKHLRRSPLHYRHAIDNPVEPTAAMNIGSATHCLVLERDRFKERFAVYGSRRAGKEWQAFRDKHHGLTILSQAEYDKAQGMAQAVLRHPVARRHLRGRVTERTIVWKDEATGLWCKGRVDATADGKQPDLKTTRSIDPRQFQTQSYQMAYHIQAAMYREGLTACGEEPEGLPTIIAVESPEPHDVAVFEVTDETLEAGREDFHQLLGELVKCEADDSWPGIAEGGELFLHLPPWAIENEDADVSDLYLVE